MNEPIGLTGGDDRSDPRLLSWHQSGDSAGRVRGAEADSEPSPPPPARAFKGFDVERAACQRLKPEMLSRAEGQFVVVVGNEYAEPVKTSGEAEAIGYERFGLGPLYIRRVTSKEPVEEVMYE